MENPANLFKGELMEELLRNYFINLGYYVVRSVKYRYEKIDITDVDLYLYGRSSSLTRDRINVDIKNKKSPQTFERILWANGLKKLLKFDSCIVATTDLRPVIHSFGQIHNTIILDGTFLNKLRLNSLNDRLTEEDFQSELSRYISFKEFGNKSWSLIYDESKSKLLSEQDFSGFNSTLLILHYFIEISITDEQRKITANRMVYLILSHLLIIIDFIIKDIAFLDQAQKEDKLSDGFKYGNLGKEGVSKLINIAEMISGEKSSTLIFKDIETLPTNILRDYFSKNEFAKNLFNWAREFESLGFRRNFVASNKIESHLKGVIGVILDYMSFDRKKYFEINNSN